MDPRRKRSRIREQLARHRAELEAIDTLVALLERANLSQAERQRAERAAEMLLSSRRDHATLDAMDATAAITQRRRGPRIRSDGPAARAAKALDISVRQLAGRLGEKYPTVKSWDQRGHLPDEVQARIDRLIAAHKP